MSTWGKMDPQLKAEWVAALRSGEYAQGHDRLCTGDAFCCLGVLADIALDGYWVKYSSSGWELAVDGEAHDLALPPASELLPIGTEDRLAALNDVNLWDFAKIADWIEVNL